MTFYTCDELTPDLCNDLKVQRGTLEIRGVSVTYWKYYKSTLPESDDASSKNLPIVAIHGGPSFTHNYTLPLKQQACRGREIVFYDQAGCGESYASAEDHPWLLDPLYYATEELPSLLEHWGYLNTGFHVIANSWGTMLSQFYALSEVSDDHPLASMVLSGPFSDSQRYIEAQWDDKEGNIGSLPPFIQERIQALEHSKGYGSPEYQALDDRLTGKFTLRTQPAPNCWEASEEQANMEIYTAMQGPSEFTMSGVLADVNLTDRLGEIDVPVLLTHGTYDTMRPSVVETMAQELPLAETMLLEKSGHVSMIDEPGKMNDGVATFFDWVETVEDSSSSLSQRMSSFQNAPSNLARSPATHTQILPATSMWLLSMVLACVVGYALGSRNGLKSGYRPLDSTDQL